MSYRPIKVVDVELSQPLVTIDSLQGYSGAQILVRLHGSPLGYVQLPITDNQCTAEALGQAILDRLGWPIVQHLIDDGLAVGSPAGLRIADLVNTPHPHYDGTFPLVTVAVCTRDRPRDLALCLDALCRLEYPALDLLVVDNAPSNDDTAELVRTFYPNVRYIRELRPGLDWARNRAIVESRGEIIAYTDDDVVVDPGWVAALARMFVEHPEVMCVTGLVVPYELETKAQFYFERYGGFGRGFERKWVRLEPGSSKRWLAYGSGQYGTGANMAYRRCLFDSIGMFDPALDVGTVTNGGGDLEMFFRVLKEGFTLVYEPDALVRHRHRRDYKEFYNQITNNGIGLFSYLVRSALVYPDERFAFLWLGLWWLWHWHIRRLVKVVLRPSRLPRGIIMAELRGTLIGLRRYQRARTVADRIAATSGPLELPALAHPAQPASIPVATRGLVAVRTVELSQPVQGLADVIEYDTVRVFLTWRGRLLGKVDLANKGLPIGPVRLRKAVIDALGLKLLNIGRNLNKNQVWSDVLAALAQHFLSPPQSGEPDEPRLPDHVPVSVVVATFDRPDDLRNCLRHLMAQQTRRPVEIVVVDNHPSSGLTPPVMAEFPGVVLVSEPRQGLAYARNAGFTASTGDIAIATDDDVTVPPDWLEKLVAPFVRADVMVVTGNTIPIELETAPQNIFENYGGLGRGFERFEVNGDWFERSRGAVQTWNLGATANAAFRANIFTHPQIGLMDEALGPGMPSGVGEDTYLFYKVLKAGFTLVYEPSAYVWHRHRRDFSALRRQIYGYSKGHVAYHLTTLLRDHDLRALKHLAADLPVWRGRQILGALKNRLRGRTSYPLWMIALELRGNFAGPWSLWLSRQRVKREGRSQPYMPVEQRVLTLAPNRSIELERPQPSEPVQV
jgi:GT2 family glycosyltransferase